MAMDPSRKALLVRIAGVAGAVAAVLGVVVFGLWLSTPERRVKAPAAGAEAVRGWRAPGQTLSPEEIWVARSEAELARLRETTERLARQVDDLAKRLAEREAAGRRRELGHAPGRPAGEAGAGPARLDAGAAKGGAKPQAAAGKPAQEAAKEAAKRLPPLPPPPAPARSADDEPRRPISLLPPPPGQGPQADDILHVAVAPPAPKGKGAGKDEARPRTVRDFLPAGAFVGVRLLSGLDAPTGGLAKSNPQPVLLRLADDGTLPNRFRSRVRECFVIAAGYGDLPSERAYLRTERLSCVARDGRVLETAVRGFVTGEDGKAGLRGRLVEKRGALIAKTLLAGTLSGIGQAVSASVTTLSTSALGAVATVEPETSRIARYGLGRGLGNALDRLAQWYLERAEELYPVIEIDAGRYGEVILTEGLTLDVDLWQEAAS